MAGFPQRPIRSAFGVRKIDARAVQNPKVELGADPMNLLFDQVTGGGVTMPLAVMLIDPIANSGAGVFLFLASLNVDDTGITLVAGVDQFNWTIEFDRGGVLNEQGLGVSVAEATVDTALSVQLIQPTSAVVNLVDESITDGAFVTPTVVQQTDIVEVDIVLSGLGTAIPFSVVVFGRNGGL